MPGKSGKSFPLPSFCKKTAKELEKPGFYSCYFKEAVLGFMSSKDNVSRKAIGPVSAGRAKLENRQWKL
jgi:hypothetical protein